MCSRITYNDFLFGAFLMCFFSVFKTYISRDNPDLILIKKTSGVFLSSHVSTLQDDAAAYP